MEILFFLLPSFLHGVLMGNFSLTETPEDQAKKPLLEGIILFDKEETPAAFRFFDKAVQDFPKSAYAYLYRAKCHFYFENYEAALPDLSKSLRLDNAIRETYLLKANCHFNMEDYDQAMLEYRRASQFFLDKNAQISRRIGELELRKGNFKSANDSFKKAADLGDNEAKAYLSQMNGYF
jgi:tetratricopeptide (TPR) repeat protein